MMMSRGAIEIIKNQAPLRSERFRMTEEYLSFQLFDCNIFMEKEAEEEGISKTYHITTMPPSYHSN